MDDAIRGMLQAKSTHERKLVELTAIADPDWQARGSICYHRDAINAIDRLVAESTDQVVGHELKLMPLQKHNKHKA